MSTVGHPLSDICNFLTPFYTARNPGSSSADASAFLPGATHGLPQPDEILKWYAESSAAYDPRATEGEVAWGMAFNMFKAAAICQGIAARYAARQASSEKAKSHAVTRGPLAEYAFGLVGEARAGKRVAPRL